MPEKNHLQALRVTEGTQRLEAFSDGIFAIAITLLVLNLTVPKLTDPIHDSLLKSLLHMWPHYLSFLLSFIVVGITWANHHEMFRFIRRSNHIFLLINLLFLMFITLMPFSTSMLGQFLNEDANQVTATAFYNATLLGMGLMFNTVWLYALKKGLINEQCNPEAIQDMTRGYLVGPLLFGTAFVTTFLWYPASLAINALAIVFFLIPSPNRPMYLPSLIDPSLPTADASPKQAL